jgi:hypothetical protein
MKNIVAIALCLMIMPTSVVYACSYNGVDYPEGTNIGGVVCQPDGSWK